MATDATTLKDLIVSNLETDCGWDSTSQGNHLECMAESIAKAVVNHIKDSAETTSAGEYPHTHDVV